MVLICDKNNHLLIVDTIDYDNNTKLNSYFDHIFDDYEQTFFDSLVDYNSKDGMNVSYEFDTEEDNLPEELSYLVDLAYEYLTNNGFNVSKSKGTIDFWHYNVENDPIKDSLLSEHCDNDYSSNYSVHSCIFYTRKDDSFQGGNLYYFLESDSSFMDFFGFDRKKYLLPIQSNTVV